MKITVCQINPTVADLPGNASLILEMAAEASLLEPDVIVFPELALPGCHPKDILLDESFVAACTAYMEQLASELKDMPPTILGTIIPVEPDSRTSPGLENGAVLFENGESQYIAAKRLLPSHDVHAEGRWFQQGSTNQLITIGGKGVSVLVGGELEKIIPAPGTDVIISLAASHFVPDRVRQRREYSSSFGCPVVYANLVGGNDHLIFDGGSFALNSKGQLIGLLDDFKQHVKLIDLETDMIPEPPVYQIEEIFQALVLGIRDFTGKNGIQRAFLGLSGGVDSAVVACLAAAGLGPDRVTGLALPSRYTDPRSTQSAEELAKSLGIGFEIVPIEEIHKSVETNLAGLLDEGTGAENLQARLRMIVLMAYVNRHGGMLLNTGNKTEAALGYATLYGDTAGSLCPIGDLTKPQVYQLANWINREKEIIPPFSIDRSPSAELHLGQVDPFDYDDIAPKLEDLVQANRSSPAMRAAEHKRAQMGLVLKVSEKAFGSGRMIPITRK
jgi:NAD+ synthase (glutamine-hydrolysing)